MRFQGLDLNLLVAFEALVSTRSVTLAAKKLFLSQSATSCALGRLREMLGDEVLVPNGKKMVPTPYAETVYPAVQEILCNAARVIRGGRDFDPALSERVVKITASDYAVTSILAPALRKIIPEAPNIEVVIRAFFGHSEIDDLLAGEIDLLFIPGEYPDVNGCTRVSVFREPFVCIGWSGSGLAGKKLDQSTFSLREHVLMRPNGREKSVDEQFFLKSGIARKAVISVAMYSLLHEFLIGTERLATVPASIALQLTKLHQIAVLNADFPLPEMHETMLWHCSRDKDEALSWFRQEVLATTDQPLPILK